VYSKKVIASNVKRYESYYNRPLVRHPVKTCRQAVDHFDDLLLDDGSLDPKKRPNGLLPDEKAFIKNEIALCRIDFVYWLRRYCFIKNVDSDTLVLFDPNAAQKIIIDVWAMLEEQGFAVACICLKARQAGISTLTEMAVAHRIQFKRDVNAIVGSSDPTKSEMMSKMMEVCWDNQPWWMMPSRTVDRRGSLIEFGGMNSGVSIQHGSQFTGIGRGTTPSTIHLSETASFQNPEELIDASLMGAFHESPDRFIVLESTAEGNSGYWFDSWYLAVSGWPKTLFYPIFLPWFVVTSLYPTVAELKRNPIPENWEPATLTLTHKQKAELYVASRPELCKHLGKGWTLSREKMWWWECSREAYKAKKELNLFLQEFCSDPDEAFQSTNISAFDADLIAELRDETKSKPPAAVYSITGATVSDRLVADARDADSSQSPISVRAHWDRSIPPLDYELFPLKFRSYAEDPMDRLYVWEPPQPNIKYVLGVDTSDGVGQDRSIVQVLRLKNPFDPNDYDEQVAEFASPYVNSRDLWPIVLAIATWYSTPQNGKLEQNRVVIECNGNGETVQHEIRKLGWWNFHPWEHYDNKRASQSNKIGWFTNVRTRSMAVDALVSSIRDGWLKIRSPWFVQEMQAFERDEGRQALRAAYGSHDDRLMSCAFALCSSYIHEITTDGRTFYSHQRKRMTAKGEKQLQGLSQAQLTAQWLKEQSVGKKPYSGNYSPY
jgi:hypothetical protein